MQNFSERFYCCFMYTEYWNIQHFWCSIYPIYTIHQCLFPTRCQAGCFQQYWVTINQTTERIPVVKILSIFRAVSKQQAPHSKQIYRLYLCVYHPCNIIPHAYLTTSPLGASYWSRISPLSSVVGFFPSFSTQTGCLRGVRHILCNPI